jgi:hypothetical protein
VETGVGQTLELPSNVRTVANHGVHVYVLEERTVAVGEMGDVAFEGQQVPFALWGERFEGRSPSMPTRFGVDRLGATA